MPNKQTAKETAPVLELAGERASRMRQRQRLIDACISALHLYGPSRTTVEKVVNIAKMSPGIVTFYFETKAAMLVAALEFLANEFERLVMVPVTALKHDPVEALKLLVDLYLDPDIASPRKVSVWYAFWGEGNSRREYFDLCGKKDETFAALVHDLIERLAATGGQPHLDTDAIALGLIGALEVIWQGFAFQDEENIDRTAAKARCLAYLKSVFPRQFGAAAILAAQTKDHLALAASGVLTERQFSASFWQFVGHETEMAQAGDYLTLELPNDRALVVRAKGGDLIAFRNRCIHRPHAVARGRAGHFDGTIQCAADGLTYGFDGRLQTTDSERGLTRLPVICQGGLVFTRFDGWEGDDNAFTQAVGLGTDRMLSTAPVTERAIASGWKLVLEEWLDFPHPLSAAGDAISIEEAVLPGGIVWRATLCDGAARHERPAAGFARDFLLSLPPSDDFDGGAWTRRLVYPNLLIDEFPGAVCITHLIAGTPDRSSIRKYHYRDYESGDLPGNRQSLANRLVGQWLDETAEIAESTEAGLKLPGDEPGFAVPATPAAAAFQAWLRARAA